MKKGLLKNLALATIMTVAMAKTSLATEINYYENDVTPPWGRIEIQGAEKSGDGINYVESSNVTVAIYANDDNSVENEISYYISTNEIPNTQTITNWTKYSSGATTTIDLSTSDSKKIYIVFKDLNGNVSMVYDESLTQTVIYDKNNEDATSNINNVTRRKGEAFTVTMQTPERLDAYFLGWSLSSTATIPSYIFGDSIPADKIDAQGDTITLYAIWSKSSSGLQNLADVANIGDYVNYPVVYDNVSDNDGLISTLEGWRVISKDVDLDGNVEKGRVNLVSAGSPLTFKFNVMSSAEAVVTSLKKDFFGIAIDNTGNNTFYKNGFIIYENLTEAFSNKFTELKTDGVTPNVRGMTKDDFTKISENEIYITHLKKYKRLFANGMSYWLCTIHGINNINRATATAAITNSRYDAEKELGVRPVVSLKPNIKAMGKDITGAWNIETDGTTKNIKVTKPVLDESITYTYDGNPKTVVLKNYNDDYMNISGDTATEVGEYTATVTLKDTTKYVWADGRTDAVEISWRIEDEETERTLIKSIANAPVLGKNANGEQIMEAVYWNDENASEEHTATSYTADMYNYAIGDGVTDTKQAKWANAKTKDDGSYWVWIPRYAYKITYYEEETKETVSTEKTLYGDIDVLFMYGTSNTHYRDENGEEQLLPEGYKVHPAFQAMTDEEVTEGLNPLGKWDEELEGIWVAKYEASQGSSGKVESKPSVESWRNITQNDIYVNCIDMNGDLNSHEMKNSEWGAVAYLTYSPYGRNGNELGVNECGNDVVGDMGEVYADDNYTGAGPNIGESAISNGIYSYNSSTFTNTYAWNTTQGKLASTTGNIYGIYDMSGGVAEYVAAYVNNSYVEDYGTNLVKGALRYKQIYNIGSSDCMEDNYNENSNIYGDGVYETSIGVNGDYGWYNDISAYPFDFSLFFARGDGYSGGAYAGIFNYSCDGGYDDSYYGFRPVLCESSSNQVEEIKYTITYNANGGELGQVPRTEEKTRNETYIITTEIPEREDYVFRGWGISSTESTPLYISGDEYTENADIVLYALWRESIGSIANAPILGKDLEGNLIMEAVYWSDNDATTEYTAEEFTPEMYNYLKGNGITDSKEAKWANAKTDDGSYWVWIPRFAYKLIHYTDETKKIITTKNQYGDVDILFMYGTSNDQYRDKYGNPQELPRGYTVHPAFQKMSTSSDLSTNPLGRWNEELEGIWVAKYEASKGEDGKVESKPSVTSWRGITTNKMYANSENMYTALNSHQMKSSEWGAVAYLTYSAYGRNGNELAVNECSDYYTGGGPATGESTIYNGAYSYDATTFENTYAWNTTQGKLASTTGNVYGVYDLSGGSSEYIASYLNSPDEYLLASGTELVNGELKNKQIYPLGDEWKNNIDNYNAAMGIYGDTVYEISTGDMGATRWCNDNLFFPAQGQPFFMRGGDYDDNSKAGAFNFMGSYGLASDSVGFRPVLCVTNTNSGTEEKKYTIRYNANGGELGNVPVSVEKAHDITYTITSEEPTRIGYVFSGWSIDSSFGAKISYSAGDLYVDNANITLYAVWNLIPSIANEPVIDTTLMQAVYWDDENGSNEFRATAYTDEMYDYSIGNGVTDTKQTKWANAVTKDGSYWVWIPRFAYKLTYYLNESKTTESVDSNGNPVKTKHGDIKILFMHGISNTHYRDENGEAQLLPEGYIVHPAFQKMETIEDLTTNPLGKWNKDIEGIWVAKYEASKGTSGKVESKPSTTSWSEITVSDMYEKSEDMYLSLNSHLMKNSEWGAVTYLAFSEYGRNGNEIASKTNNIEAINLASTTGNIYGVYDLAGGKHEVMASYVKNYNNNLTKFGSSLVDGKLINKQVYAEGASDSRQENYDANSGIYGDAVYETSTFCNSKSDSWLDGTSYFPYSSGPFFVRGDSTGIFSFTDTTGAGDGYVAYGFRPVLCLLSDLNTYPITYNANGGELGEVPEIEQKSHGVTYTVTDKEPTREGYTFLGWSDSPTATIASYVAGYKITANEDATLYAVWDSAVSEDTLIKSIANAPVLGKNVNGEQIMEAVYWDDENATTENTATSYTSAMYNYEMGDGVTDTKQARWANAVTEDGSYWVWIPRYAYKITYYEEETKETVSSEKTQYGDIKILFMYGASKTHYRDENGEEQKLPGGYTVHPAFQAMTDVEIAEGKNKLGKWDEELEGIWVAKYEASEGSNGKIESKPSVMSWGGAMPNDAYTQSLNMISDLNSHQMKNSEWGAVAYLTYSAYGRNGNELGVNESSEEAMEWEPAYTGAGPYTGSSLVSNRSYDYNSNTFASTYAWNTEQGKLASTTGNIYGVYDMSGGNEELVASYVNNGKTAIYASNIVNGDLRNKQVYDVGESLEALDNYNANREVYGDAIYETSNYDSNLNWCNDRLWYPYSNTYYDASFFTRGGNYNDSLAAGIFAFYTKEDPYSMGNIGFRPVLCVSGSSSDTEPEQTTSQKYTITYDANDGILVEAWLTEEKIHDVVYIVTDKAPNRTGYSFLGWSDSPTATEAIYTMGDEIVINEDITLYAVWRIYTQGGTTGGAGN